MTCFRPLGVREGISWTSARTIVEKGKIIPVVRPSIGECGIRIRHFDLLFMAFCCCFLDLSLAWIRLFHSCTLSLGRALRIKRPGFTIGAVVNDLTNIGDRTVGVVVAFDVLPGLTPLAKDRVAIVLVETTNALDGVVFLIFCDWESSLDRGRKRAIRVDNRRRKRVIRWRDIGHNMAESPVAVLWVRSRVIQGFRSRTRMTFGGSARMPKNVPADYVG